MSRASGSTRPVFRTALSDLLGIEYPIVQSGMGLMAGPELAAGVSNAGGLGILAGFMLPPDPLRDAIRDLRGRTDRPFGVNLWLSDDLRPPAPASAVSDDSIRAIHAALNPMRTELGLPAATGRPSPPPDHVSDALRVVLEERVPVLSVAVGNPGPDLVADCHRRGIKVMAMVTTLAGGRAVQDAGVDAVVAQGAEAGGHRATFLKPASADGDSVGTMALVPQLADGLRVPIVAAGGIADGRGVVAALALGASGVLLGTRFLATRESMAFPAFKESLLAASGEETTVTDVFTGRYARVLRTPYIEAYRRAQAPVLPFPWQHVAALDVYRRALAENRRDLFPMLAGQSVGIIDDLPAAADVVDTIVREARAIATGGLARHVRLTP